jgi:hypothetical protein
MSGHNCIFRCNHIPIINVLGPSSDDYLVRLLTSFFGGTIIVATGLLQLTKAYENWINYRNTAEQLKQEYQLFALKAEDYSPMRKFQIKIQEIDCLWRRSNRP